MELVLPDNPSGPPSHPAQMGLVSAMHFHLQDDFHFHPAFLLGMAVFAGNGSFCWFLGPNAIEIDGQAGAGIPKERLDS